MCRTFGSGASATGPVEDDSAVMLGERSPCGNTECSCAGCRCCSGIVLEARHLGERGRECTGRTAACCWRPPVRPAPNPIVGSRVQQTCKPREEQAVEVVRNGEGGPSASGWHRCAEERKLWSGFAAVKSTEGTHPEQRRRSVIFGSPAPVVSEGTARSARGARGCRIACGRATLRVAVAPRRPARRRAKAMEGVGRARGRQAAHVFTTIYG